MANLKTTYLGIDLKNPIIVGANNMVTDVKALKKMENAGAAAIVYKSLFEEQIQLENLEMGESMNEYADRNAEMVSLFPNIDHAGPEEYLMNLYKAQKAVDIPIIASLNAVYHESWVEYAQKIAETGVKGLELNFYSFPKSFETAGKDIVDEQLEVIKAVRKAISIPVSVKLSPFYTNTLQVIKKMDELGVSAFTLFNNLIQPDIDIEEEATFYPYHLSSPTEQKLSLRYAGLLYGEINAAICSNTGIYQGSDVIKMILAGATAVHVVSTLYKNKIDHIQTMLQEMEAWMDKKSYSDLAAFRGKLSRKNSSDPYAYKRAQYVDILMKSEDIFKKYPMV